MNCCQKEGTVASYYEQLAEECAELAHAALKVARVLRGENPTPVTLPEAKKMVIEELSDLIVAYQELGLNPDPEIMQRKKQRWNQRRGRQA